MSITQSKCVCIALSIEHPVLMRNIDICDLPHATVFFHIVTWKAWFPQKNFTEHPMSISIYSAIF